MDRYSFQEFCAEIGFMRGHRIPDKQRKLAAFLSKEIVAFVREYYWENEEELSQAYVKYFVDVMKCTGGRRDQGNLSPESWEDLVSNWGKKGTSQSTVLAPDAYYFLHTIKHGKNVALQIDRHLLEGLTYKQKIGKDVPGGYTENTAPHFPIFLKLPPTTDIHSYAYAGEDKIPMLGREAEQATLERFVNNESDKKFQWLQIAGVSGQGKTRHAWELIQEVADKDNWNAGFWNVHSLGKGDEQKTANFKSFWENWNPDSNYLLVLDYVTAIDPVVGEALDVMIDHIQSSNFVVRLLLLERQRWDRGGLRLEPNADSERGGIRTFSQSSGPAVWFEELDRSLSRHDLASKEYRFEETGVIELETLSSEQLIKITKQIFRARLPDELSIRQTDDEIAQFLFNIDRDGRPLYAFFVGQALADGGVEDTWTRDDLLNHVLTNDYKKRWKAAFKERRAPTLYEDHPALDIALLACMSGGFEIYKLVQIAEDIDASPETMERVLVLVNGPIGNDVFGPAEAIPPLQPDILGEWFALNVLRARTTERQDRLIRHAWNLFPAGMARFLLKVAQDFPKLAIDSTLFDIRSVDDPLFKPYTSVCVAIAAYFLHAKVDAPRPVVSVVKFLASNGIVDAMFVAARCCESGSGTEQSDVEALNWYLAAAQAGDTEAQHYLGYCYQKGILTTPSAEESVKWYKKAIKDDHPTAMNNLAMCYFSGEGVELNRKEAQKLFHRAAEAGEDLAMFNLSLLYDSGEGVAPDSEKAFYWFNEAAKAGHAESMFRLGMLYRTGILTEKSYQKGFDWSYKAAKAGHPRALYEVGQYYLYGNHVKQSYKSAFNWFHNAAEAGNIDAMLLLGQHYEFGQLVQPDLMEAIKWFQKAVEFGDRHAILRLTNCYEEISVVERNSDQSVKWYHKALADAETGDPDAIFRLSICYKYGIGREQNSDRGLELVQKAVELGSGHAMLDLSDYYANGIVVEQNDETSLFWNQKGMSTLLTKDTNAGIMNPITMTRDLVRKNRRKH